MSRWHAYLTTKRQRAMSIALSPTARGDLRGCNGKYDEAQTCIQCDEAIHQFQLLTNGFWEYDYFQDSLTLDRERPMVMFDKGRTPFTVKHVADETLDFLMKYLDRYCFMPVVRWYVAKSNITGKDSDATV